MTIGYRRLVFIHTASLSQLNQKDSVFCNSLSEAEKKRVFSLKFEKDRASYIAAHSFLRQTLSRYADLTVSQWQFEVNLYGKPFIINPEYENLYFNLSHSQDLVACAISYEQPVGVDIEYTKPLTDLVSLCRYAFSMQEANDILSIQDEFKQRQRFFCYWTLKEAYIKARGKGLSIPLHQFTLAQNKQLIWHLVSDKTLASSLNHWHFANWCYNTYHFSVSVRSISSTPIFIHYNTIL